MARYEPALAPAAQQPDRVPEAAHANDPTAATGTEDDEDGLPCVLIEGNFDPYPQTVTMMSAISDAVIVGRFSAYGQPYWNTPDHSPPDLATLREGRAEIRTPILLEGVDALLGDSTAAEHAVLWNQGRVGCVEMTLDTSPDLRVGDGYVFFLSEARSTLRESDGDQSVMAAWPIDENGDVATALDGILSVAELDVALGRELPAGPSEPEEQNTEPDPDSGYP